MAPAAASLGLGRPPLIPNVLQSMSESVSSGSILPWNVHLAVQKPHHHPRAWERVPTEPHRSTPFRGPIMKCVGLGDNHPTVIAAKKATEALKTARKEALHERDSSRVQRRTNEWQASSKDAVFYGQPPSEAMIANLIMTAKVAVANNYMNTSSSTTLADKKRARAGDYPPVVPRKRYINNLDPERIDAVGGNKHSTYRDMMPLLHRTMKNGLPTVDVLTASSAHASAIMRRSRPNPRQKLAIYGQSDLSIIEDEEEPHSAPIMMPPANKAESKSPAKRLAKLVQQPIQNIKNRISDTLVKLNPISSNKAEPSPIKPSSAPSTPLRRSPTPTRPSITPTGIDFSPNSRHAATAVDDNSTEETPLPGRTFRCPSYKDSTTASDESAPAHSPVAGQEPGPSPAKIARLVAHTPSRWNRPEPVTPQVQISAPSPNGGETPIGLAALLPILSPLPQSTLALAMPDHVQFDFGEVSTTFNAPLWAIAPITRVSETNRARDLNSARRRRSEPLVQRRHKEVARRKSASPAKITNRDDLSFLERSVPELELPKTAETQGRPAQDAPADGGMVNIDMRETQDIFAGSSSVEQLAKMAKDYCSGEAKVFITQEAGRLIVRFKLPIEYATSFPSSQGFDNTMLSTSPLGASTSPRLAHPRPASSSSGTESMAHSLVSSPPLGDLLQTPSMVSFATPTLADFTTRTTERTPLGREAVATTTPASSSLGDLLQTPSMVTFATPTVADYMINASSETKNETGQTPFKGVPEWAWNDRTPTLAQLDLENPFPSARATPTGTASDVLTRSVPSRLSPHGMVPARRSPLSVTPLRQEVLADGSQPRVFTPLADNGASARQVQATPTAAATPTISFTPANQRATEIQPAVAVVPSSEMAASTVPSSRREQSDDSPGRDFLRAFIKDSRSRRQSTTDAGSPIAPETKRQPLGVKSPNTPSPLKTKRKRGADDADPQSQPQSQPRAAEPREPKEPLAKRTRRARREKAQLEIGMNDDPAVAAAEAEDVAMVEAQPPTRRSSRLRGNDKVGQSSIPTPIKVGRGRGAVLNSTVRTEQQALSQQTLANTRKNKGKAEYPADCLVRLNAERGGEAEEEEPEATRGDVPAVAKASTGGKTVEWKDPLVSVEPDKPKRGRAGSAKTKVTLGKTGVTKPGALPKTGTPVRPTRSMRPRTRSQA